MKYSRAALNYLITFAVILQASRPLAVTSLPMSPTLSLASLACLKEEETIQNNRPLPPHVSKYNDGERLTYFRMERRGIPFQTLLDGSLPLFFVIQIVEAVLAVAVGAEFPIGKTVTIPTTTA